MSRAPREWSLPGPAAFVERAVDRVQAAGMVAVVAPGHFLPGIEAAFEDRLGGFHMPVIDAALGEPPLEALSRAFDLELRSAAALPAIPAAEGRSAMVVNLDTAAAARWETTLRAFLAASRDRLRFAPVLLLVAASEATGLLDRIRIPLLPWRGVIGMRDAMLWALRRGGIDDPVLGALAAQSAVCLAGWELAEIDRQMDRFARAPRTVFDLPQTGAPGRPATWETGEVDLFDSEFFPRLAVADPSEIRRRLWRAQVTVLFPWIEGFRVRFVIENAAAIADIAHGAGGPNADPADLEWSDLARLIADQPNRSPPGWLTVARHCRNMRNALAHRENVDFALFERVQKSIRAYARPPVGT